MDVIYLAGSISGLDYQEATGWRDSITSDLSPKFKILNPMRNKEHLSGKLNFSDDSEGCTATEIFNSCINDVASCDIFLAYITGFSIGTSFELGLSWAINKHIVVVTTPELALHPFILGSANIIFSELKDAVKYLLNANIPIPTMINDQTCQKLGMQPIPQDISLSEQMDALLYNRVFRRLGIQPLNSSLHHEGIQTEECFPRTSMIYKEKA